MSNNNSDQQQAVGNKTSNLHLFLSLAGLIGIIFLAGYVGNQFQEIEDQLRYQAPINYSKKSSSAEINIEKGQTVYVPAYSHVYSGSGDPHLLTITLSIRNTDPGRSIKIVEVRYFNTGGELVKNYIEGIIELAPLETVDILVEKQDRRGGSGANFIVTWKSDEPVYEPIIEALMIGLTKEYSISFITAARPLADRVKKNESHE